MARGSIYRKDNGWAFRVDAGINPATGKRRQVLRQGFPTKKQAESALAELVHSAGQGTVVAKSGVRLGLFLEEWLNGQRSRLRATTWHSYDIGVRRIDRHIGHLSLQGLTALQLEGFYADLLDGGGAKGTDLSPKTVRNTHVVLRKALADAERLGLVPRNVAASARAPAATRPEFTTWSSEDLKEFFAAIADHRLYVAFIVFATTGMRRSEVLGLRWRDIDLDAGQLAVVQTLPTVNGRPMIGQPKTQRSRRTVFLDPQTVSLLRDHRRRQREERLAIGEAWDSSHDLAFRNEVGGAVHPDWFSREFKRLVADAGLPPIRLHDLRHTHATLALKAGVHPKVVSERLGHATVGITLDLYSHVTPGIARDAADAVAAAIFT